MGRPFAFGSRPIRFQENTISITGPWTHHGPIPAFLGLQILGESKPRNLSQHRISTVQTNAQEPPSAVRLRPTFFPSFDTRPSQIPVLSGSFSPSSAMAGGNMFARALSYVVNEFLVEGLANKYTTSSLFLPLHVDLSSHFSRAPFRVWFVALCMRVVALRHLVLGRIGSSDRFPTDSFPWSHIVLLYHERAHSHVPSEIPHEAGHITALTYMILNSFHGALIARCFVAFVSG
jgi:hypothetical protein